MAVTEIHTKQRCVDAAGSANHSTEMKRQTEERWMGITCVHELYRVIHKSLRDFRTRLHNNQERHGRKEHINR